MDEKKLLPDDIHAQVLVRSWRDPQFRELVKKDPRQALKQMGYEVPDDLQLEVGDMKPGVLRLEVAQHPAGAPVLKNDESSPSTRGIICKIQSMSAHCTKTIQYCSKTVC
ncbi:MAG TPA: hypothetical protein VF815_16665 [Myxococcaceae bacterium]|jgi:hypothetical protein